MATRSIPFVSASPRFSWRAMPRAIWAAAREASRVRTTRRMLAEMDGRMLADIGVSRSDAEREAARPFWDGDLIR